MATPVLIATAGAADANTYCTLTDANTYISSRLHVDVWNNEGSDNKNKALLWATAQLDDLVAWNGLKASSTQILRWPRTSVWDIDGQSITSSAIPQFLKDATAEFAFHLLSEDRSVETNRDLLGFKSLKIGPLSMETDNNTQRPILPLSVQNMIRDYTAQRSTGAKSLVRM